MLLDAFHSYPMMRAIRRQGIDISPTASSTCPRDWWLAGTARRGDHDAHRQPRLQIFPSPSSSIPVRASVGAPGPSVGMPLPAVIRQVSTAPFRARGRSPGIPSARPLPEFILQTLYLLSRCCPLCATMPYGVECRTITPTAKSQLPPLRLPPIMPSGFALPPVRDGRPPYIRNTPSAQQFTQIDNHKAIRISTLQTIPDPHPPVRNSCPPLPLMPRLTTHMPSPRGVCPQSPSH